MSDSVGVVTPATVYVVDASTWMVCVVPSKRLTVMVEPSTAVTWPATLGRTSSIFVTV